MAHLSISVPKELEHWVDTRIAGGPYADATDYLRSLIQRDQDEYQEDLLRVRALVRAGWESGIVDAEPEEILSEIISEIMKTDG